MFILKAIGACICACIGIVIASCVTFGAATVYIYNKTTGV